MINKELECIAELRERVNHLQRYLNEIQDDLDQALEDIRLKAPEPFAEKISEDVPNKQNVIDDALRALRKFNDAYPTIRSAMFNVKEIFLTCSIIITLLITILKNENGSEDISEINSLFKTVSKALIKNSWANSENYALIGASNVLFKEVSKITAKNASIFSSAVLIGTSGALVGTSNSALIFSSMAAAQPMTAAVFTTSVGNPVGVAAIGAAATIFVANEINRTYKNGSCSIM